jgi:acetyltransferase-like isoleucine patch superfamily enzyme
MDDAKPSPSDGLFRKALWILRHRPSQAWSQGRTVMGFLVQHHLLKIWPVAGVKLSTNVRVQKRRVLMAEAPHAQISVGANSILYENARLEAFGNGSIEIGANSILGDIRINSRGHVVIGDRFLSAWGVFIQDTDTHPTDPTQRGLQCEIMCHGFRPNWDLRAPQNAALFSWKPTPGTIEIGNDVWIGAQCSILKNVKIGSGCIVATGSVVLAGDYPPNSLIAGNPARVVKTLQ